MFFYFCGIADTAKIKKRPTSPRPPHAASHSPHPFIIQPPDNLVERQPELKRLSQQLALKYAVRQQVVSEADLRTMGSALWQALDLDEAFAQAHQAAGAAILAIIVESGVTNVQALPWETLYHPTPGFLGKQPGFTLSRRMTALAPLAPPLERGPLRVLLFTAPPDDVDPEKGRLNLEEEQAQVQEALLPWIGQARVQLEMPDDGRFATLQDLLKTFRPHLLFLSGHGRFHFEPHSGEAPYGEFLFESESGGHDPVKDETLAQSLVGIGVQAVVLAACESGKVASDALNHGLAQSMSELRIPHVIGMRESVTDRAEIQFARALCDAVAQQERLDFALQTARIAIQAPFKGQTQAQAELSQDQWCLPMLLSPNPEQPLIDWDFKPQEIAPQFVNKSIQAIGLPLRFVGRRAEMRQYKSRILDGKLEKLLISGPGGQGKTALAGKLALNLEARNYHVFAWAARLENPWRAFRFKLELALDDLSVKKYDRMSAQVENERERAELLLDLLLQQFKGRLVLFLDNLETLQNPDTLALIDTPPAAWLQAAQSMPGLILLVTSRWQIPGWPGEHLPLTHANYGDFLQMAQQLALRGQLPAHFLDERERIRRVYDVLSGNGRGLEFFAGAIHAMRGELEESAFLERLAHTQSDLQANLTIAEIYQRLPPPAQTLLARLPVYPQPVPEEGILKLALDLDPAPKTLLDRLLAVSLVEVQFEPQWEVLQYQCPSLIADWLRANGHFDPDPRWLDGAADYQMYLYRHERDTLSQAIITHAALRRAGRKAQADRLALDDIVGSLSRVGFFQTLLDSWLPEICQSEDLATQAQALGETGNQNHHIGDYETALAYLQKSLVIYRQIGNKFGEGITLNNISQIYDARGDYETALAYLQQSLSIRQQIGNKSGEGTALNNISQIYAARGDYETALAYLQKSLAIQQQIGDKSGEGTALNNISQIYAARGDYETALAYLQKSLAIMQQIGDKSGEEKMLSNIGNIFLSKGDYETALAYFQKSLVITQQIGDKASEGISFDCISMIYYARGDYETALAYRQKSLAIMQQIGDKSGEGTTLNNISQIYHSRGDYETALAYLQKSLAIMQQIGDKSGEGTTLNNISQIFKARGDYETALAYLQKSLAIRQQIGDKSGEGTTLNNISQIFKARGDYETALAYLQKSLAIQQQIGDNAGLCVTLFNMGHIHAKNQQIQEAVGVRVTAYRIAKQIGHAQILQALAKLAPQLGLPSGLEGWEELARRAENPEG
jgi:tetratricopeptide (TPR) repeat protein